MRIGSYILILVVSFWSFSCKKCGQKVGSLTNQQVKVPSFRYLNVIGDFDIVLVQDSSYNVEFSAGSGLLENINYELVSDTLRITNENSCAFANDYNIGVQARIGIGDLEKIEMQNPASLTNEDTLKQDFLELQFHNCAVKANLTGEYNHLKVHIFNGTPTVLLKGNSNFTEYLDASYGHIYSFGLANKIASVNSNGTGLTEISATDSLYIKQDGSGIIRYLGNPKGILIENSQQFGGKVVKAN